MIQNILIYVALIATLTSCPSWIRKSSIKRKKDTPLGRVDGAIGGSANRWDGKSIADTINRRVDPPISVGSPDSNCASNP